MQLPSRYKATGKLTLWQATQQGLGLGNGFCKAAHVHEEPWVSSRPPSSRCVLSLPGHTSLGAPGGACKRYEAQMLGKAGLSSQTSARVPSMSGSCHVGDLWAQL